MHLAGAGVGDHRWTAAYKAEIRASRVLATRALASALVATDPAPKAFICASAIGWYGDTGGREVTESAPAGKAFLSRVVHDWEAAADPAREAGIRVAHLRRGLVLGAGGGVLGRLALPARLGVLPRFGDGHQVMSWISLTDEIRAIRFLLDGAGADERSGAYNLTAPNPVGDDELTAALHAAFKRPDFPWLRCRRFCSSSALARCRLSCSPARGCCPARLLDAGFVVRSPDGRRGTRRRVACTIALPSLGGLGLGGRWARGVLGFERWGPGWVAGASGWRGFSREGYGWASGGMVVDRREIGWR